MPDYNFLHSVFPNYTISMWQGNEPSIPKYSTHVSGAPIQHWSWEYGSADTYSDDYGYHLISASTTLPSKLRVFICGDHIELSYIPHVADDKYWTWTNDEDGNLHMKGYKYAIPEAKIRRMMSKELPDSLIWRLIKERMWELFEAAEYKGDYRE